MTNPKKLLVATRNSHKTEEIAAKLEGLYEVSDLTDSSYPEVEETGTTFLENATLKALSASRHTDALVLSDDSGIEVSALGDKPGVFSSSYGGEEGNHQLNNEKLMNELQKLGSSIVRTARFKCIMVLAQHGEVLHHLSGVVEGQIIEHLRGTGGFGYDPLFIPDGYTETFAELGTEVKNTMSHRGRALDQVIQYLQEA